MTSYASGSTARMVSVYDFRMPISSFRTDQLYTRPELAALVGHPSAGRKGGDWYTGYARWNGEFFIFCNVGVPGKTGHDYPNQWDGPELEWSGKTGSRQGSPVVKAMLSGAFPVHLFWRGKTNGPFTYAGRATAVEVEDTSPVQVRWSFGYWRAPDGAPTGKSPVWRRGPPPSAGPRSIIKHDGPTHLYLMKLDGGAAAALLSLGDGLTAIKIGITNDLARRLAQLNFGFPPGVGVEWRLHRTRTYPSGKTAFAAEGKILEALRLSKCWIGGEFAVVSEEALENLLVPPRKLAVGRHPQSVDV